MSCFLQEEGQDDDVSSEDNIITQLFNDGFTNKEICHSLETYFGLAMSERTLKRRLNKLGLKRRCNYQLHEVVSVVEEEVRGSGSCLGYRAMTSRLRNRYGIRVPRTVVSGVQRLIDPEGVRERASGILRRRNYSAKGPNYLIHVDGHDKLKPYGFAIHGAIDGYSRRILWLNVSNTNNDPAVIGWYFVDFIEQIKAVPRCVRIDAGTENGILASIQEAFLTDHTNEASVVIGRSTSNQRIERWWRTLRHSLGQYWMNLFKDMADRGLFSNADPIHIDTLRYCFFYLITNDLLDFQREWNTHVIGPQSNMEVPSGKPDLLYFTPEVFGTDDYKVAIDTGILDQIRRDFCKIPNQTRGCDPQFSALCDGILAQSNFGRFPSTSIEACDMYDWLLSQFR
ncbi:uncharacterized protein LOC141899985 isoform X1 [Tubulanus polymorphus]|uniref:uncharacterized protein LOC141899985 isoform X1 n=1 Tax=Tubulanus polymorphus TaxID=672921 RepID=UPI003DA40176